MSDRPSLSLRQLLDTVLATHPLVEAAQARVRAARGSRVTAGAFGNPVLGYQVENAPLPGRAAPPMDRETMTTATMPLEPLYQRGARVRRADADIAAASAEAVATRRRVALDAAHAFYRVALAQEELVSARDLRGWLDIVVLYNRDRVTEGVTAEADLIRSQLERDRAAADAAMREADLARARATLVAFVGEPGAAALPIVVATSRPLTMPKLGDKGGEAIEQSARTTPGQAPAPGDSVSSAQLLRALARRPDVRAIRERVAAGGAGIASERSMLFRQFGAMVGTKQSAGTTSLVAGLSMPIPLFDSNRGEIARVTAERDANRLELAASERVARGEIVGAWEAARLLTERAGELTRTFLANADEARRIALGAYREGAVPLLQVLDAARAWADARAVFYRILFAQHQSVLELAIALGFDPTIVGDSPANDTRR